MQKIRSYVGRHLVGFVALFIALGGTSYAAANLPPHSVGTAQLKDGAVTDAKVDRHSLTGNVFAPGTLRRAATTRTTIVYGPASPPACPGTGCPQSPAGTTNTKTVTCADGQRVVGGGYELGPEQPDGAETVTASVPVKAGNGWQVTFALTQAGTPPDGIVAAVCAS